ncbi:26S proteasome non-ATPase regulatory subunit 4 [Aphelenchoides bicaudatus]|nr:26S proteasome non-ATPase regulatory subunit 4 [Aphelenchoides bicaudatus]
MERESVVICIDNSEWMRNGECLKLINLNTKLFKGDLIPTRLQCQQEAVNLVMQCKLRANPESGVGLLAMADQVEVLSTMTREERKLFIKLHEVQIKGDAQIVNAIKVSHLALRHRMNRNHKMRIVMFVGSPIEGIDKAEFIKLAKKLKKEKVNIDFICFGEAISEENQLLSEFVDTVNGKDNTTSSILIVPGGSKLIEALVTSPICQGENGGNMAMLGNGGVEFGDPDEDPELALALRISLEEQRQAQGAGAKQAESNGSAGGEQVAMDAQPSEQQGSSSAAAKASDVDLALMTEEEQLEWALRMSMANEVEEQKAGDASSSQQQESMDVDPNVGQLLDDPELLQQLVEGLPDENKTAKDNKNEKSDTGEKK